MKWAFEEDFIVCDFYLSHITDWKDRMNEVMSELQNAGFGARPENSVRMRIHNYKYLHTEKGLSHVAKQTRKIYNVFARRMGNPTFYIKLKVFIESNFIPHPGNSNPFAGTSQNASAYVPIEPLGPSFQDTLFRFIDQRGMKDSEVYNSCFVGRDTFSHIRKGDRGVSKKTIKQLCFGLKLSYEDAVILMESAGYAFSNNSVADLVVVYFLKNEIYDIFAANAELYERNEELLFAA